MKQTGMDRAYRIADELIKDKLRDQAPDDFADIESMDEADILVVQGVHDCGLGGERWRLSRLINTKITLVFVQEKRIWTAVLMRQDD